MIGQIEYKGINSGQFGVYFRSINRPLLPPMRSKTKIINGSSGAYDFGDNDFNPAKIEIRIAYVPTDYVEREQRKREIAAWLSSNTWQRLILGNEPDKYYLAKIYNQVDLDSFMASGEASVTFECQPFAYMIVGTGEDLTWEQADFPWITDMPWIMSEAYTFTATGTKNFTFNNPGTKEINFRSPQGSKSLIKVNGAWTTLSLSMNGKTLSYNKVSSGELVIDNVEMEIELNGANVLADITGALADFLVIKPGDNIISVSGTGLNITVTIDFAPMWL